MALDQGVGNFRDFAHGVVTVVDPRLRVDAEQRTACGSAVADCLVSAVCVRYGVAHTQGIRRLALAWQSAKGRVHASIGAASALKKETPVPVRGHSEFETDSVLLVIDITLAFMKVALHETMC